MELMCSHSTGKNLDINKLKKSLEDNSYWKEEGRQKNEAQSWKSNYAACKVTNWLIGKNGYWLKNKNCEAYR